MIRDNGRYQVAFPCLSPLAASLRRGWERGSRAAVLGLFAVGMTGCSDWAGYDLDRMWGTIPALATLRGSISYEPYELPRLPAEGTVPVVAPSGELLPPFTQQELETVAAALVNPLEATPEVLERGQRVYETQCYACHGPQGGGDGPVVGPGKYPFAPAVNTPQSAARSDGYIYGVIRAGRGLMPAYGERITHLDRWAVVHYVRHLQRQGGVPAQVPGVPTVVNPADSAAAAGPGAPDLPGQGQGR